MTGDAFQMRHASLGLDVHTPGATPEEAASSTHAKRFVGGGPSC